MSVNRIKISSTSITERVFYPTWSGEIAWENEDKTVYYRLKPGSDFTFRGEDYADIIATDDCEEITIIFEVKCGTTWYEKWQGRFTKYDCKVDKNKCVLSVEPRTVDDYDCFLKNYDLEKVVAAAGDIIPVKSFAGFYEGGVGCCNGCVSEFNTTEPQCATPSGYCFDHNTIYYDQPCPTPHEFYGVSCFHRVTALGTLTTPPPYNSGWTHLGSAIWWRCPTAGEATGGKFGYGRLLNDILEYLATLSTCTLTVRSHFFGINATHAAPPSNTPYTYATEKLQHITVHQKSDIKQPDATNTAQTFVWKMRFKTLLEDLETIFDVLWKIDGSDLIIEHRTYFDDATAGLDATGLNLKLKYEKTEADPPKKEFFVWMDDATFSIDHSGYPIEYDCGESRNIRKVNLFSNDVFYIKEVENPEEIQDAGFCMIANTLVGTAHIILDDNKPLGWKMLHDNLHRHNRYFLDGKINNIATTFDSVKKTRKLEPFTMPFCCDDILIPERFVQTNLGDAKIKKATINYNTDKIEIESNI